MDKDRVKGTANQAKGKIKGSPAKPWAMPSCKPKALPIRSKGKCRALSAARRMR